MSNAAERSADIGWFLDHHDSRFRIRASTEYDREQTPNATITLIERLPDFTGYRYVRLVCDPEFAAKVIAAGEIAIGECHFLPNGRAVVHFDVRATSAS